VATIIVQTTAEDGDIDNSPLTVFSSQQILTAAAYDSTKTHQRNTFWFFNTDDAVTGLPADAILDSVKLWFYVSSTTMSVMATDELWFSPDGALGATLDSGDFATWQTIGYPHMIHVHPDTNPSLGWWSELLYDGPVSGRPAVPRINRSGYTNVVVEITTNTPNDFISFHAFENPSGNRAYLEITYHLPANVPGQIVTTYLTNSVNAGAAGISFSSLATPERDQRWIEKTAPTPVVKTFNAHGGKKGVQE
jgi:hypothetical protein